MRARARAFKAGCFQPRCFRMEGWSRTREVCRRYLTSRTTWCGSRGTATRCQRPGSRESERLDPAHLRDAGRGDRALGGFAGPCAHASAGAGGSGAFEAGAIEQEAVLRGHWLQPATFSCRTPPPPSGGVCSVLTRREADPRIFSAG